MKKSYPSPFTPALPPGKKWGVTVQRLGRQRYATVFCVPPQYFTVMIGGKENCQFIRKMFLKALKRLDVTDDELAAWLRDIGENECGMSQLECDDIAERVERGEHRQHALANRKKTRAA